MITARSVRRRLRHLEVENACRPVDGRREQVLGLLRRSWANRPNRAVRCRHRHPTASDYVRGYRCLLPADMHHTLHEGLSVTGVVYFGPGAKVLP